MLCVSSVEIKCFAVGFSRNPKMLTLILDSGRVAYCLKKHIKPCKEPQLRAQQGSMAKKLLSMLDVCIKNTLTSWHKVVGS